MVPIGHRLACFSCLFAVFVLGGCDHTTPQPNAQQPAAVSPEMLKVVLAEADALFQKDEMRQAAKKFERLAELGAGTPVEGEAHYFAGESYRGAGLLESATQAYLKALDCNLNNPELHQRLAFVLSSTGQNWLAPPYFGYLVSSGAASIPELALFGDLNRPVDQRPYLEQCAETAPDDAYVQMGLAIHDFWEGHADRSRMQLRKLISKRPDLLSAQAIMGQLLVDGASADFIAWHQALPAEADANPDIWIVRALYARRIGAMDVAERCLSEAVERNPQHRRAIYQLAQMYEQRGDKRAVEFSKRAEELILLTQNIDAVLKSSGQNIDAIREVSLRLESIGRIWEACAWALEAKKRAGDQPWITELFERRRPQIAAKVPIQLKEFDFSSRVTVDSLPPFDEAVLNRGQMMAGPDVNEAEIQFKTAECGINFTYENGAEMETTGPRMFEQTGGAVAVCDFDRDHRPDLFFTQGQKWKQGEKAPVGDASLHDVLYRNRGDGFVDAAEQALPTESAYGQGASVGDFNCDGLDDIYVGNLGKNQLLINQGDGTFVEQPLDDEDTGWTASVSVVDLNDDSFPDLFDANYLAGEGIFVAICNGRACSPSAFAGAPNRLRVSRGDGTAQDVQFDQDIAASKSLGVLVLPEPDDPGRPSLFVANDQTANGYLTNEPAESPGNIRLVDDSLLHGLAYNDHGLAMACMGIAADDPDRSGTVDLFVTNFSDESNTLYLRDKYGAFVDGTGPSGLEAASFEYVGWGTQWLDADLDGWPDLTLVNGNVDDDVDEGEESEMRPQFFRNVGEARFQELFAPDLGDFFGKKYRGRGLARVDWNNDGLPEFVVSNLLAPASVLKNTTPNSGHFVNFNLHATATARDAIGTRILLKSEQGEVTRMLLAGDGYMASNQRILQFGLGKNGGPFTATVHWPSGHVTTLNSLAADATYEVVEGSQLTTCWREGIPYDEPASGLAETSNAAESQ